MPAGAFAVAVIASAAGTRWALIGPGLAIVACGAALTVRQTRAIRRPNLGYMPAPRTGPRRTGPRAAPAGRALGLPFGGRPGPWNAITDVPGVEVGYVTLIEGDRVRTGVTAIHPRGPAGTGDQGFHAQNGNGEMTGSPGSPNRARSPDRSTVTDAG